MRGVLGAILVTKVLKTFRKWAGSYKARTPEIPSKSIKLLRITSREGIINLNQGKSSGKAGEVPGSLEYEVRLRATEGASI